MLIENRLIAYTLLALLVALIVSFLTTPIVKTFAYKVGAIDVPKDARRMHKVPIPRLGGLAIFIGFMVSILLFVEITAEMRSILLGAVIIVVLGVVDDIMALPALLKFVVQIVAALIPALNGVTIQAFSNPNIFSDNAYWVLGNLSIPLTVLWIVAITNSVNLIDGLDGLANGVSAISATTVLVIITSVMGAYPLSVPELRGRKYVVAFVLLPMDAFSMDAFTEIYLTLEGAETLDAYSDAYQDLFYYTYKKGYQLFSGRNLRTVSPVRHISLSCKAFNSAFSFSR